VWPMVRGRRLPLKSKIRLYCAEREITQRRFASELGITPSHLCQILSRRQSASLRLAVMLEELTGIPAREFVRTI
jgi:transcriptional regulator with XRE-family HTH domain